MYFYTLKEKGPAKVSPPFSIPTYDYHFSYEGHSIGDIR